MRRFFTLAILLCLAIPAGVSFSGCTRNPAGNYCNGLGYGPKLTDVASVVLQPETTGISLAYGMTQTVTSPSAYNCKGQSASVAAYTYSSTNAQLVDISPSGSICAGTWNRNTGGGIPNYTICSAPATLPETNGLPYAQAFITAAANGVSSNTVTVRVHPKVTAVALSGPASCLSQGQTAQLDGQACWSNNGVQSLLCAPAGTSSANYRCPLPTGVSSVPACSSALGNFNYTSGNSTVFTIDQYGLLTAIDPGTAVVTASISGTGASAGYVSTCPPSNIAIALNGQTTVSVNQGITQNLTSSVTDINGNTIVGLALNYQSTNLVDITASSAGAITTSFPGNAAIYAVCQPTNCNPAPVNEVGVEGTGLPVTSNAVNVTVPGTASTYAWFGAPNVSQYFTQVELLTGTVGQSVRLPYLPNSMAMDASGTSLYFGNSHELMIYAASSNSLSKEDTSVPGTVLAVSPDNTMVLINDQTRQLFYIYRPSGGSATQFGGLGVAATFTPDSRTLYILDSSTAGGSHTDTLYTWTFAYGWNSTALPNPTKPSIAVTVPGVGAFLAGTETVANTWCVSGTAGDYSNSTYYPNGATFDVATDALVSTSDGGHVLGATYGSENQVTLTDFAVNVLGGSGSTPGTNTPISTSGSTSALAGACPYIGYLANYYAANSTTLGASTTMPALELTSTMNQVSLPLTSNAGSINQIVSSKTTVGSTQNLAFVLYSPSTTSASTGATLPWYLTNATNTSLGTNGAVTLVGSGNITAPIAGAFSPDNTLFFLSTAGDNMVHYINVNNVVNGASGQDEQQISPGLLDNSGNAVPATVIVVKPRSTT